MNLSSPSLSPTLPPVTLVLGGARSGKTRFGERLVRESGAKMIYLATATRGDGEMSERIDRHIADRGPDWTTVEEPIDLLNTLVDVAKPDTAVLVDCLTLWLTNLMVADRSVDEEIRTLVDGLPSLDGPVVFVSNEVGHGIVPMNAMARSFRDHAGFLHQDIAARADQVVFVVAGLPMVLKAPCGSADSP